MNKLVIINKDDETLRNSPSIILKIVPQKITYKQVTPPKTKPYIILNIVPEKKIIPEKKYYCYLLQSISRPRRTYIGYTINPKRRLRQHNGEIKGGAKKTSWARPWRMICYIGGFPTAKSALQFEWANHHPQKKQWGVNGRIRTLSDLLYDGNWTKTSPDINTLFLEVNWLADGHSLCKKRWNCVEIFR